ncbi:hypothetical protein [Bowmanella yangjiangensis]|uniref:Uncharacterized protein n=1 Tax=Bowmanella yangjiangensis TaxID=2811230 RepID=A0ABS3CNM8_9ALTE|nr:hypothetical protein [Bowmanella yangjiangensis]MBN7818706.1 hypothetical protein [Bowmanella yangjiangensis]
MIQKDYYRLAELEAKFGVSQSDIQYLIEQGALVLATFLPSQRCVFGDWREGKFVGLGIGQYRGIVRLSFADSLSAFSNKSVQVKSFEVPNSGGIFNWSGAYPFSVATPNEIIHKWIAADDISRIYWSFITAMLLPTENDSPWWSAANAFAKLDGLSDAVVEKNAVESRFDQFLQKQPKRILNRHNLEFELKDACVLYEDLKSAGLVATTQETPATQQLDKVSAQFRDDFDELLARILQANKTIKAKGLLRILAEEARMEEDSRKFDIRNILLDEVEGKIVWLDHSAARKEKAYGPKTISNRLTEVRKAIS